MGIIQLYSLVALSNDTTSSTFACCEFSREKLIFSFFLKNADCLCPLSWFVGDVIEFLTVWTGLDCILVMIFVYIFLRMGVASPYLYFITIMHTYTSSLYSPIFIESELTSSSTFTAS